MNRPDGQAKTEADNGAVTRTACNGLKRIWLREAGHEFLKDSANTSELDMITLQQSLRVKYVGRCSPARHSEPEGIADVMEPSYTTANDVNVEDKDDDGGDKGRGEEEEEYKHKNSEDDDCDKERGEKQGCKHNISDGNSGIW
ncbi:hypothetical protein RRG08_038741 [Elysia crispata]|uniref:Uncharacterized protein n=1 Tax=Elysia crispata TaxID=231223 RepID=A0AAE1CTW8_9GAST|nr:hypothetical protein RRG08_038741 [Elysia crispata]